MQDRIATAIELSDLDELVRIVDALCDTREWDLLVDVRDRARRALERGRQLWPAASRAEYRLALDAPARYAAAMLVEDAARFAPGPVAEVAASTHAWAELAPHAPVGPVGALAAHERVVRGELVDAATVAHADVLGVPLVLEAWEPDYPVAAYRAQHVEAPAPDLPRGRPLALPTAVVPIADPDVEQALRDVVRAWTAGSEGQARVAAVEGDAPAAIAALGFREVRGAWLAPNEAIALLAWAGASGGVHGRRRGAAAGRDLVWSVLRRVLDLDHDERPTRAEVERLQWVAYDAPDVATGWILRVAVADPAAGFAWAIDASDRAT